VRKGDEEMSTRKSRARRWLHENYRAISLGEIQNVSRKLHHKAYRIYALNFAKDRARRTAREIEFHTGKALHDLEYSKLQAAHEKAIVWVDEDPNDIDILETILEKKGHK
jgi:hypothetical protein